jgi:peptidoglycan/LPS O-acetylase OafA/YrhL
MKDAEAHSGVKSWLDAWHVNPSVNRDYDFIDGLRGVAILMVVVGHMVYFNPRSGPAVHFIGSCFSALTDGVVLFFVLSGFLIAWPFWKMKVAGSKNTVSRGYGWRRFWKIYPPLALSIVLLTPIYIYRNADWPLLSLAAKWLVGLPFVWPVSGRLNPVMWSLVVEVQFYVLLPLLFLCLKQLSAKACLCIITLIFLVVPFLARLATRQAPGFIPDINAHFPTGLDYFCVGIFVAGLDNMGFLKAAYSRIGVAGVLLWPPLMLLSAWIALHPESDSWARAELVRDAVKLVFGCMLLFVAAPQHPMARLLCAPWLRWCGLVSYEWYLFHQPIYMWIRESLGPAEGHLFKYAVIVGGSFLVGLAPSALIYRCFSLPILRYGRAKRSRSS